LRGGGGEGNGILRLQRSDDVLIVLLSVGGSTRGGETAFT